MALRPTVAWLLHSKRVAIFGKGGLAISVGARPSAHALRGAGPVNQKLQVVTPDHYNGTFPNLEHCDLLAQNERALGQAIAEACASFRSSEMCAPIAAQAPPVGSAFDLPSDRIGHIPHLVTVRQLDRGS